MDIVETVAEAIAEIPGDPSHLEIARIAIEAYQRAIWTPAFGPSNRMGLYPELRRNRANQLTAAVLSLVGKHLCDHGDADSHREASRSLMEAFYEAGVEAISDADRAAAGLPQRGPYGMTAEDLRLMEAKRTEAMLRPFPQMVLQR